MGPITSEYSERKTQKLDHQGQINIPATGARGPVLVSTVDLYSLAYDANDVMDNGNCTQIWISLALIGTVIKPSIDLTVLAERWGITSEKDQKTI